MTRRASRRGRPAAASLAAAVLATLAAALPAHARPRTYTIVIAQMSFGRPPADLRAGDTIEWVNRDILRHTVTARNGAFDLDLQPGGRARLRLAKPGVIRFYCRYHPGMTGTLRINPPGSR